MKVAARVRHAAATLLRLLRGRTVLASTRSAPPSPDTVAGGGGGSNLLLFLLLLPATFLLISGKFSSDSKEAHFLFFMRHSSSWRRGHSKRRQGRTVSKACLVSRVSYAHNGLKLWPFTWSVPSRTEAWDRQLGKRDFEWGSTLPDYRLSSRVYCEKEEKEEKKNRKKKENLPTRLEVRIEYIRHHHHTHHHHTTAQIYIYIYIPL